MSEWISVRERLPARPGELSKAVWVACCEFGQSWHYAVARCFISTEHPDSPSWYYDREFYGMDNLYHIGCEVHYWQELPPEPPEPLGLQYSLFRS